MPSLCNLLYTIIVAKRRTLTELLVKGTRFATTEHQSRLRIITIEHGMTYNNERDVDWRFV